LKQKENALVVHFELPSAQKSAIAADTKNRNNVNNVRPSLFRRPHDGLEQVFQSAKGRRVHDVCTKRSMKIPRQPIEIRQSPGLVRASDCQA
jgi:hypothetical protein